MLFLPLVVISMNSIPRSYLERVSNLLVQTTLQTVFTVWFLKGKDKTRTMRELIGIKLSVTNRVPPSLTSLVRAPRTPLLPNCLHWDGMQQPKRRNLRLYNIKMFFCSMRKRSKTIFWNNLLKMQIISYNLLYHNYKVTVKLLIWRKSI